MSEEKLESIRENLDLDIESLNKIDVFLSKSFLETIHIQRVDDVEVESACKGYTTELYDIISCNYNFFNKIYHILSGRYRGSGIINTTIRHIILTAFSYSLIKDLTTDDKASLSLPRYKMYNTYSKHIELLFVGVGDIVRNTIDTTKEFFIILHELCKLNTIKKITKRVGAKTEIFYEINFIQSINYSGFLFSYKEYITFIKDGVPYVCSLSIHSIRRLIKANNHNTNTSRIDLSGLEVLNKTKVYIDEALLERSINLYKKYHKDTMVVVVDKITSIINKYRVNNSENKAKIYNISHEIDNIDLNTHEDELLRFFKKNYKDRQGCLSAQDRLKKKLNSDLSTEVEKLNFLKFVNVAKYIGNKPFYIPHHSDFRGRMYSSSQLSPILHKYLRCVLSYGVYTEIDLSYLEARMLKTRAYKIIQAYTPKLNTLKIKNKRPIVLVTLLFLFIELSKKNKIKLIDPYTFSVGIDKLIDSGIETYVGGLGKFECFEDELEYEKTTYHINSLIHGEIYNNFIVAKDSTASVLQHLFK